MRNALENAENGRTDLPDEVYLVETESHSWAVYPLRAGGEVLRSDDMSTFRVFNERDLLDLTGRA